MNCKNCGAEIVENNRFCPVCGQKIEQNMPAENQNMDKQDQNISIDQSMSTNEQAMPDQNENTPVNAQVVPETARNSSNDDITLDKKNRKKPIWFKVGIVAAVLVVLVGGVYAGAQVIQRVKKASMNPTQYYQHVEKNNRDICEKRLKGSYEASEKRLNNMKESQKVSMKLSVSDTAKSLLSLTGTDFSKFSDIEMELNYNNKDDEILANGKLKSKNQDLISLKAYYNSKDKKAYAQIPEISKSYLDFSNTLEKNSVKGKMDIIKILNALPKSDEILDMYENYTDIYIDNVSDVKKSSKELNTQGVKQKTTVYTATYHEKEIMTMEKELFSKLKSDNTIKELINAIDENAYYSFTQTLEDGLNTLKEKNADNNKISITNQIFVNKKDEIAGRKISIENDGNKLLELDMEMPQDGDRFGCYLSVKQNGIEYMKLTGNGTKKSDVINGEFVIGVDQSLNNSYNVTSTDKLIKMKLENYNLSKLDEGKFEGTVIYSTDAIAALANYNLKITSTLNDDQMKMKFGVMAGKDELASIDINEEKGEDISFPMPGSKDKVYDVNNTDDIETYKQEMDSKKLIEDIENKLGVKLTTTNSYVGNSFR